MKKLSFISIFMLAVTLTFVGVSCEKEARNESGQTEQEASNDNQILLRELSTTGAKVYCSGECDEGAPEGARCNLIFDANHIVNCGCEGCAMNIEIGSAEVLDQEQLSNVTFVESDFFNYLEDTYPDYHEDVLINSIEVINFEDEYVLIKFEFEYVDENEETIEGSVVYKVSFDGQGGPDKKFEIDCSGSCDSPTESCTENYNLNTGDVSCNCEGECSMTVTELSVE